MDLLQKLKEGTKNHVVVKWPGQEHDIEMRVATEKEMSLASLEADRKFKGRPIGLENAQAYSNYKESRVLYTIISDPEKKTPIGKFEEFEALLTPDVKECLDDMHEDLQDECSPNPDKLTEAQLKTHIDNLKKNFDVAILDIGSTFTAKQVIKCLVSQALTSQVGS